MAYSAMDIRRQPFYLSQFQEMMEDVPSPAKSRVTLLLRMGSQGWRGVEFWMPAGGFLQQMGDLGQRYLLAMMNNMVVSFGGETMEIYLDASDGALWKLAEDAAAQFQWENPKNNRTGYGVYVNYISRMNPHLGWKPFSIQVRDKGEWVRPDPADICRVYRQEGTDDGRALLRRAADELSGKTFCSLDVGGNSIKGAVVRDGEIALLKEHCWYPTGCKTAKEMLDPMLLMVRLLRACTQLGEDHRGAVEQALLRHNSTRELEAAVLGLEELGVDFLFDAVVIGFPDIVVNGKIAGGESFKHKGLKEAAGDRYDAEFQKTVDLDDMARAYVKPAGAVVVLNDGNAASLLTSVEQAFVEPTIIQEWGMFCNTIGPEMGTGFISRGGTIQSFPLEGFQHVIDLGNTDFAGYPAGDIRSTGSMNTGIAGTVQKYVTQLGLFRMAVTGLMEQDRATFLDLVDQGLLQWDQQADLLTAAVEPVDRRGELTRALVRMLEEGHPVVEAAFLEMGRAMGVLMDQDRLIFPEISTTRLFSGGIVAPDSTFGAICRSLEQYNPDYKLIRLDEEMVFSPLLKKMRPQERNFNVAIGSAYIGNLALLKGGA